MKKALKQIIKYILVFLVTVFILMLPLTATEKIGKDTMHDRMESSALYLCEREPFFRVWKNAPLSMIDRYADSILLSIAYHTDGEHPLTAAMWSSYYHDDFSNENENLLTSVQEGAEPGQQYMRYWHGSVVPVRLFHLFTDIKGMYIVHGILLAVLFIALVISLWRYGMRGAAVGMVISALAVSIWFVPLSLEYYWVFLIMCAASLIALWMGHAGKWEMTGSLFLITGIITNYLDFLTAETLTLTVPLLLIVMKYGKERSPKESRILAVRACALWLSGYAFMWVSKWLIAGVVLGENVMPYVSEHIVERMGVGDVGTGTMGTPAGAVFRNISCIWSALPEGMGLTVFILLMVVLCCFLFAYRRKKVHPDCILLYALIGLIPYIRYMVLHNHAYIHFFFTYRAQMGTILALWLIAMEVVDESVFRRVKKSRRQRG